VSRTTGALLVVAAGLAMAWRAPVYLAAPSFWAEEGLYFFATAWNGSWSAALVQRPATYLHLYANVATLAAAWVGRVSVAAAPRVTAWAGLAAQLVPVAVVAFGRAPEWGGPWRRALAAAVVVFGARTGGIWMNSVTAQDWLALTAFLLVLEPATPALLLALCGLSGPGASFAAPVGTVVGVALFAGLVAVVAWLATGLGRGRRTLLAGAFALATVSIAGAVGEAPRLYAQTEANQRYFFAPSVLFLLLLLGNVRRGAWVRSVACGLCLATGLVANAHDWRGDVWWRPTWTRWADEVRVWEADPRRPLGIWPYPWTTRLRPRRP
jgi:hypothetical protein